MPAASGACQAGLRAPTSCCTRDCIAINPFTMTIRLIGGKYVLANGSHLVKAFPNLVEAKTGLRIMRKLKARYSCFVGRPGPSMTYLRRI